MRRGAAPVEHLVRLRADSSPDIAPNFAGALPQGIGVPIPQDGSIGMGGGKDGNLERENAQQIGKLRHAQHSGGNVGSYAAKFLTESGVKVVAISDAEGALRNADGNVSAACTALGLPKQTMYHKMQKYGLVAEDYR